MPWIKQHWRGISLTFAIACCALLYFLHHNLPPNASEEYKYTVLCFYRYLFPLLALYAIVMLMAPCIRILRKYRYPGIIGVLLGIVLIALTFFAPNPDFLPWEAGLGLAVCWLSGLLTLGLGLMLMGARVKALAAGICCALGSVCLALGIGEGYLLFMPQLWHGMHYDNPGSRYVISGVAQPDAIRPGADICGYVSTKKGKPLAVSARYMRYDEDIYDVKYDFDAQAKRPTPPASENPHYDLMLFGCSFTFGTGLNTEETWAWKLAKLLGPDWDVENYAYTGYSANQMLCWLEHELIAMPNAPKRYALFLAISDHLRRNEFFDQYPHYVLDQAGQPRREGYGRYIWINNLPGTLKGSQLARKFSIVATGIVMQARQEREQKLYLAILRRSSEILRQKYNTQLIVLLWPDFEDLAPELEKLHIPAIFARSMLPAWDEWGAAYQINAPYEAHPNARAADDLAKGLAKWFEARKLGVSK